MEEKNLFDLAKKFGSKILKNRSSTERVSKMCSVSREDAIRIRQIARELETGTREEEDETPHKVADGLLFDQDFTYNGETDTYLTFLKGVPKPIVLSGDSHRSILRAYSNWDGQPATINEVAREFGIPRTWLIKYLRVHGMTHDREPFTQEELLYRSEEEMVEEGLQMLRMSLHKKFEKARWNQTKLDADKWRRWKVHGLHALENAMAEGRVREVQELNIKDSEDSYALVLGLSDFHHGKYADESECGEAYNREIGRKRLFKALDDVFSEALLRGRPDKIYLPVGSDFLHIDTYGGTTTKGTAQDTDGNAFEILETGCHLMEDVVDYLRPIAPVELVLMPGNHDRMAGLSILLYLEALYRKCDNVIVSKDRGPRAYRVYGNNLIGFVHGDGASKTTELAGLMANEASEFWHGCKSKTIYTGHRHNEKTETDNHFKVTRRQLPSLAGTDRYHKNEGYDSLKALPAYVHSYDRGLVGVVYSLAD